MISSRLCLFTKLCTNSSRLFLNSVPGISCGCKSRYILGVYQNTNFCTVVTPAATTAPPKKKKTVPIPKITLVQGAEVSVTSLEDAQKLSKRRNLKLVKIIDIDTKTERPVYQLMTPQEYNAEDLKQREQKKKEKQNKSIKGEKILLLGPNIAEHDLKVQINKITRWVARFFEVKVVINGDSSMSKAESVYSTIEKGIEGVGRIVQKRQKGSDIKFQVIPPKKQQNESESNSTNTTQSDGGNNKPKND